jgi:ArsR family transcriptional regulator
MRQDPGLALDFIKTLQYSNIMRVEDKKPMTAKIQPSKASKGARCLRILGHPARLSVIAVLSEGSRSVNDLAGLVGVSQSNLSQHLSLLKDKGIIDSVRDGHQVFYRIANPRVMEFMSLMEELFCHE